MCKLFSLAVAAAALAALPHLARADPVTWTFYETGCVQIVAGSPGGSCPILLFPPPALPAPIATLILPGPTSSGSASWLNETLEVGMPFASPPPVLTGDTDFSLSFEGVQTIAPPTYGTNETPCFLIGPLICQYNISWSETNGKLDSIAISIFASNTQIGAPFGGFGLSGGGVATDFMVGSCEDSQCQISGFWQSDLAAVPEPTSAALLLTGLLIILITWALFPLRAYSDKA